jgi:hypothetical protein
MLSDSLIALIRTGVPAVVGTVIAFLIDKGINISDDQVTALSAALIPLCISLYYALATYLERNVNPAFGWLLGNPKAPSYGQVDDGGSYPPNNDEYTGE